MNLFLSGGGSGKKSILLDRKFAESLDKSKPLLYIPIAIDKKKHPYDDCLKWISNTFNPLGIKKIELWTEKDILIKQESDLQKFCGIYIGGGNTYYLLKELKNSGFIDKLKKIIKTGISVYGGSAGAIILGKTIQTTSDKNNVKIKDFSGLDVIKGYSIFCHYGKPEESKWVDYSIKKNNINKAIALPEDCGLYVTDKKIEVVGFSSAYITNKKMKEIKPGTIIDLN